MLLLKAVVIYTVKVQKSIRDAGEKIPNNKKQIPNA